MDLAGKVVLVTGASSGIGEAIALALAARRAKVVLVARRKDRLDALAARVGEAGGEALVAPADLRDDAALESSFRRVDAALGRLDVLVNNAGLGLPAPLLGGLPALQKSAMWREMWGVNVHALTLATSLAIERFDAPARGGEGGHIVHISSMAGHRVPPGGGFYAATKFAVRALTEGLRQELRAAGRPHRVSAISPGFVETEFFERYHAAAGVEPGAASRAREPAFRFLEPRDVASSVLHVLEAPAHVQIHDVLMRPTEQAT